MINSASEKQSSSFKALRVLKFGGSSLATNSCLKQVVSIISTHKREGHPLIVVVSARGKQTDQLIQEAKAVSPHALSKDYSRELDMLITSGERMSMALLCMALKDAKLEAVSFTGSQTGIVTDNQHGSAKILSIKPYRIEKALNENKICIVAGFQGVSYEREITSLGRGGSDTTAIALAHHFKAEHCYLYSDYAGYYSADPKKVQNAKILDSKIHWETASELSKAGAKLIDLRAISLAQKKQVPIKCLSTSYPHVDSQEICAQVLDNKEKALVINIGHCELLTRIKCRLKDIESISKSMQEIIKRDLRIFDTSHNSLALSAWCFNKLEETTLPSSFSYETGPFEAYSLVGYKLLSSKNIIELFQNCAEKAAIQALDYHFSDRRLSLFTKSLSEQQSNSFLNQLHEAFIKAR